MGCNFNNVMRRVEDSKWPLPTRIQHISELIQTFSRLLREYTPPVEVIYYALVAEELANIFGPRELVRTEPQLLQIARFLQDQRREIHLAVLPLIQTWRQEKRELRRVQKFCHGSVQPIYMPLNRFPFYDRQFFSRQSRSEWLAK